MYIYVPPKPRISRKADISSFSEIILLLSKHGFGISSFYESGVAFYDRKRLKENTVPVSSYFKMDNKEFTIFTDVLKRLDIAEKERIEMIRFINRPNFV